MPRVPFPVTNFTDLDGSPLSDGYLIIRVTEDTQTPDGGQLCAGAVVQVDLDSGGNVEGSPTFWGNNAMLPNTTAYLLNSYNADGQKVLTNLYIVVQGTGPEAGFGEAFGSEFAS